MPKTKTIVTAVIIFLAVTVIGIAFDRTAEPSFTFTHNDNTAQASMPKPDQDKAVPAAKTPEADFDAQAKEEVTASTADNSKTDDKINLNTATAAQLTALPGVVEVLAGRIVEYREQHGNFTDIKQIKKVKGIGDKKFAAMKDMICVE